MIESNTDGEQDTTQSFRPPAPEDLVHEAVQAWGSELAHSGGRLRDHANQRLAHEGSMRLRQVLTQLSSELDLARAGCRARGRGEGDPFMDRAPRMLSALDRAHEVLDHFLDRELPLCYMVELETQTFDLAEGLSNRLDLTTGDDDGVLVQADLDPAPIEGDPLRLLDVLVQAVQWFRSHAKSGDRVVVRLRADPPRVRGFIGLDPSRIPDDVLVDQMGRPYDDPNLDAPYARAVVERHGGVLFVHRCQDLTGFGFTLPLDERGDPHD